MTIDSRKSAPFSRIDQVSASVAIRDAISNEIRLMHALLRERGYSSDMFGSYLLQDGPIEVLDMYRFSENDDANRLTIFHFSTGSDSALHVLRSKSPSINRFHNITPIEYFLQKESLDYFKSTRMGMRQFDIVRKATSLSWADSAFNAKDLVAAGFKDILILPVLRHYSALANLYTSRAHAQGGGNGRRKTMLFVGRLVPNKAQHDLVVLLSLYLKHVSKDLRLVLVGGFASHQYCREFLALAARLGLVLYRGPHESAPDTADIVLAEFVTDESLAQAYGDADVFCCLSDHEGFCVPLVEAMTFGLPTIAHDATAVGETLGDGGILLDKRDWPNLLAALKATLHDEALRSRLKDRALDRAKYFAWDRLVSMFDDRLAQSIALIQANSRSPN